MPLSIKNETTERLARQVAGETGESITEAIQKSLEERWERLKERRRGRVLTRQIDDILRRVDALPTLDDRSPEEILGYAEHGLPRGWSSTAQPCWRSSFTSPSARPSWRRLLKRGSASSQPPPFLKLGWSSKASA